MTAYEVFNWYFQTGYYSVSDLKDFTPFLLSEEDFNKITASKGGVDGTTK